MKCLSRAITVTLVLVTISTLGVAGNTATKLIENHFIIRMKSKTGIGSLLTEFAPTGIGEFHVESLIQEMNLYLVKVMTTNSKNSLKKIDHHKMIDQLRRNPNVVYVVPDHEVKLRGRIPNDTDFPNQWSHKNYLHLNADIRSTEAWVYGTGGVDRSGHEIVVAVVDDGFDSSQRDLLDNTWFNNREIEGNGVDDDGNGYIDDFRGWNAITNSGNLNTGAHGTHVAGIIGARGDNQNQVSGVNWNVKMMNVQGASGLTSIVVRAYGYVMAQKRQWIATQGVSGANVVATNSSFGVDGADCLSPEFKIWNDLYDAMGDLGILSAVATANQAWDIDQVGDVPSGCPSPFVIGVTNTDMNDKLSDWAGYGLRTIALGAPGTEILSTLPGNSVGRMSGTSMATPYVAGAIAYLHSVANTQFNNLYRSQPTAGALELKRIILSSVDPVPSLNRKTSSGGRLNLLEATKIIHDYQPLNFYINP